MLTLYFTGAKRELLLKSKFDALAKEGGQSAVKKAIERRQTKVAQKEKKSRPFAPRSTSSGMVQRQESSSEQVEGSSGVRSSSFRVGRRGSSTVGGGYGVKRRRFT